MTDHALNWKDVVLTLVLMAAVLGLGFYFGFRVQEIHSFNKVASLEAQVMAAEMKADSKSDIIVEAVEVPEVYWLAPGGQSNCPDTHPIKGKFTSTGNVVYAPENKMYKRITAHLCFANIDYAVNKAGFIQKQD